MIVYKQDLEIYRGNVDTFGTRPTGKYFHVDKHEVLMITRMCDESGEDNLPPVEDDKLPKHLQEFFGQVKEVFECEDVLDMVGVAPNDAPFDHMWVLGDYVVCLNVKPLSDK
ncbi:hypothetical protein [Vibrio phage phiKT1028]|nr:hypothetical protein [Vibrio phage phiKT1028]